MLFLTTMKRCQKVLFILISLLITIYGQSDKGSPCPHLFKYKTRYDSYRYGVLSIPNLQHHEGTVTVIVLFTLRAKLPTVSIMICTLSQIFVFTTYILY